MSKPLTKDEIEKMIRIVSDKLIEREIYRRKNYPQTFGTLEKYIQEHPNIFIKGYKPNLKGEVCQCLTKEYKQLNVDN